MKTLRTPTILPTLLPILGLSLLSYSAFADSELPDARSLVEAHLAASGGKEALKLQGDSSMTGRFLMPAAGMQGNLKAYSRGASERVVNIELEGIGSIQSGYKDGKAWSMDPFTGPRWLSGVELDMQVETNEVGAMLRTDEYVESMQTVGTAEFDGKSCYEVAIVWKSGRESVDCYSTDTGFMLAQSATMESAMGSVETVMVFSDYESIESGGVEMSFPMTTTINSMGQQQQMIIDSIEIGTPADEVFTLPPAIAALQESADGEAAAMD
ncbi:MAG: hypothetical protein AAGH19_07285 [Pseudomonadota bacterium]